MVKKKKYTVSCYVEKDGELIPWESLTEEEREARLKTYSETLSRLMTQRFREKPELYEILDKMKEEGA